MKKIIILMFLILPVCCGVYAELPDFPLFDISQGAKAAGFGGAFTAGADDSTALSWNPSALAYIKKMGFGLTYNKWAVDASLNYITAVIPAFGGAFGASVSYVYMGSFVQRDEYGTPAEDLKAYSINGGLGYGLAINPWLGIGVGLKAVAQTLDRVNTSGFLIDAGVTAQPFDFLKAALVARNYEPGAGAPDLILGLNAKQVFFDADWALNMDLKYSSFYGDFSLNTGLESGLFKMLYLRMGWEFRKENTQLGGAAGLAAGLGVQLQDLNLDYAFTTHGVFGDMHTITLSFLYEGGGGQDGGRYNQLVEILVAQYKNEGQEYFDRGEYEDAVKKWENIRAFNSDYPGLQGLIDAAKKEMAKSAAISKLVSAFDAGMKLYTDGKYSGALKKWQGIKKTNAEYPEIDIWIDTAVRMIDGSEKDKQAEACFNEGLKYFNLCMFEKSVEKWAACPGGVITGRKVQLYSQKAKERISQLNRDVADADAYLNTGKMAEGVKKLRDVMRLCPGNAYAVERLAGLKGRIINESEKLYKEGLSSYINEDPITAMSKWEKIEMMDPEGNLAAKAKKNIEDAKQKIKGLEKMHKKIK